VRGLLVGDTDHRDVLVEAHFPTSPCATAADRSAMGGAATDESDTFAGKDTTRVWPHSGQEIVPGKLFS